MIKHLKPEYCDEPEEQSIDLLVLEDNGDRLLVEYQLGFDINPTAVIRSYMVEA